MSGRHLCLNNCASPQAQPSENWTPLHSAERLPLHGVSHCSGRHSIAFINCEEPGSNPWRQTTLSCRFALYNICKIWSFLTKNAMQLLVQALVISRLDYCNSLLAGLPASELNHCSISRTLQRLPCDLNWLPVAACIWFKMMVLAFKAVNGTAPIYLQTLVRPHTQAQALRSTTSAGRLAPPSLRASKGRSAKSRLFCDLAPQWTNFWPMSGWQSHSPYSAKDSRLTCSDFTSTPHIMTPGNMLWFLSCDKYIYCKSLWTKACAKCPKCKFKVFDLFLAAFIFFF